MTATARTFTARGAKNDTHASTSDPDSRLREARWAGGKAPSHGPRHHGEPAWAGVLTLANGTAERRASEGDAENQGQGHRITAGEDKADDTADHVTNLRALNVTPQ